MSDARRGAVDAGSEICPEALAPVRVISATAALWTNRYERWLHALDAYGSRHLADRQVRARIVREVLSKNLALLAGRRAEESEIDRLEAAANRPIAEVRTGEDVAPRRPPGPNEWAVSVPTVPQRPR